MAAPHALYQFRNALVGLKEVFDAQVNYYLDSLGVVKDHDRLMEIVFPPELQAFLSAHPHIRVQGCPAFDFSVPGAVISLPAHVLQARQGVFSSVLPHTHPGLSDALELNLLYECLMTVRLFEEACDHVAYLTWRHRTIPQNTRNLITEAKQIRAFYDRWQNIDRRQVTRNYKPQEELDDVPFMRPLRRAWFLWDRMFVMLDLGEKRVAHNYYSVERTAPLPEPLDAELAEFKTALRVFCGLPRDSEES